MAKEGLVAARPLRSDAGDFAIHPPQQTPRNTTSCVVIYNIMDKQTVSFRLDEAKVEALDTLAEALDRDRTYLLNEAVAAYLDVQQWHIEQIERGIRHADAGKFVDHAKVKKMVASWRRK